MKLATGIAALTVAVASAFAAPAIAQELPGHANAANAAAFCQGTLPAFAGTLRARPLAIQNEGSASAFVSCAYPFDSGAAIGNAPLQLDVYFNNTATTAVTVNCTAVSGWATDGDNEFIAGTTSIAAGGEGNIFWDAADFESGLAQGLISISCGLPSGAGIADGYIYWDEAA